MMERNFHSLCVKAVCTVRVQHCVKHLFVSKQLATTSLENVYPRATGVSASAVYKQVYDKNLLRDSNMKVI